MAGPSPLAWVSIVAGLSHTVAACPYSIRDAGFIARDPSPYRLCLVLRTDTPQRDALADWLKQAAERHLADSNVITDLVTVDASPDHPAAVHCRSAHVDTWPAAVLLSPTGEALLLSGGVKGPLGRGAIEALVADAASSPKREELLGGLVEPWCVVVLAEGTTGKAENAQARKAIQAAIKAIDGAGTPTAPRIEHPPKLLALERGAGNERVLLWSLGLLEGDLTRPRAAVVFGAGRRLGPALEGAEITEATLLQLFQFLGMNCTCTSDPSDVLGPQVPLAWGISVQTQVAKALGFDPNSPRAVMTLAGVWTSVTRPRLPDQGILGYTEQVIEFGPDPAMQDAPRQEQGVPSEVEAPAAAGPAFGGAGASRPATAPAVAPSDALASRTRGIVVMVVSGLAVVAVGGSVVVALRRARKGA